MSVAAEITQQLGELPCFLHVLTSRWLTKELARTHRYMISFPAMQASINHWTYFGEEIVKAEISSEVDVEDETIGFTIMPNNDIINKLSVIPQTLEACVVDQEYWIARVTSNGTGRTRVFENKNETTEYLIKTLDKQLNQDALIQSYDIPNITLTKIEFMNDLSSVLSQHTNLEANLYIGDYSFSIDFFHVKLI
jgi:hypothetical protein